MGFAKNGPRKHKDHAQDCETLIATRSASGDPAMVFIFRMASILSVVRASRPAQRPDCCWTFLRMTDSGNRSAIFKKHAKTRATCARELQLNDECCAFRAAPCSAPRPFS